ncbi:hypothetical protein H7J08_07835 [Mycobacterium frederiksbergense]|uniref:hypothetical protein n=1 Tax=Mycolicibacterium frederiksbergense TaxID=117567 RepID=UPI0021F37E45|nr:hypothetical protein [Mycolicibacterium frederiksbergense]MCV7044582.1 hypothetical protein [Mycolicibacterium frederiksbergense]
MTPTWILFTIYVVAAVTEVAGIVLTVGTYIKWDDGGNGTVSQPETWWQSVRGPALIGLGVLIGLGGNIVSLFLTR